MIKIAKETKEVEKEKVQVSLYKDEFETVADELDIKEITSRNVRVALGLKETHSKTGAKSKLIKQIREMSKEEAEEKLKEIGEDDE